MDEIPDEYGLSSDSLRGSHTFVQPHQVGADGPNARLPLSRNEIRALQDKGILVDADGYEREPEPVIAPPPPMVVRMRTRPGEPVGEDVKGNPVKNTFLPSDDRGYIPPTQGQARPSASSPTPQTQTAVEQPSQGVVRPDGPVFGSVPTIPPYGTPQSDIPTNDVAEQERVRAAKQTAVNPPSTATTPVDTSDLD